MRAYAEYLELSYLKEESWSPTHDFRVGFDMWRERDLEPLYAEPDGAFVFSRGWSEVYANLAYQKTNFYLPDYRSLVFGLNTQTGIRGPRLYRDVFLMPYVFAEVTASEQPFFWQNRGLLGAGVRIMPFQHSKSPYLNKLKVYAEYIRVAGYLKEEPLPGVIPKDDFRIGIAFTKHR